MENSQDSADIQLDDELPPVIQRAQETLAGLNDRALTFARERPLTCIIGAVALGFIVGKIAARY